MIETKDDLAPTAWKEAEVESYKILGAKTYSRTLNLFHTWPTGNSTEPKGECVDFKNLKKQGEGFHLGCNYDWTGEMFKHLYSNIPISGIDTSNWNPKNATWKRDEMLVFDQSEFTEDYQNAALLDRGQLFIPSSCHSHSYLCHLHIFFHSCHKPDLTLSYSDYPDIISYANSNKIVVLMPEADICWNTHTNTGANKTSRLY